MTVRKSMEQLVKKEAVKRAPLLIDPTEYADPLFGVGSATSAGPTLPAGSIHPSPETLNADCGGYLRNEPIVGFGQAYTSGAGGTKCYGNFLLCPTVNGVEISRERRASFAKKGSEVARSYEYKVTLENGISAAVTPAHNAAIYRFDFPDTETGALLLDAAHKLDIDAAMRKGEMTVDPVSKCIYGGGTFFGNWSGKDWDMYFAMAFDADVSEIGAFVGEEISPLPSDTVTHLAIDEEKRFGAYLSVAGGSTVYAKIAFSFVSAERAKEYLSEIDGFDYEKTKESARSLWRETLGVIELSTDDKSLLRRFYTALYHMNIQPRDRRGDHGFFDDFHTVWDSWKTVFPMYCLLYPEKMGEIVDSMLDRADKNLRLGNGIVIADEFMSAVEGLAGQGGNDVDNVISDAYLKGIQLKKHTWEEAYRVLLRSAYEMRSLAYIENGLATDTRETASGVPYTWRFRPAAATMGFALNDKAISAVAKELGTKEEYETLYARSANFLNIFNKDVESEGFYCFPQSRNKDGGFDEGFDAHGGYNVDFYEATAWDASYINYNDHERLIEVMGGAKTFTERLLYACEHSVNYYNDDHGAEGYLNFTNEPSFHIPWLFCVDGIERPDLAAKVIDGVIKRFSLENDYPGDEDNGGMASYSLFLMCGFFPFSTTDYYYLHGTRVEKIVFRLGNGRDFTVSGENVKEGNIYVQSATLNGKPLHECKIRHGDILAGGELHFVMGDMPSMWARKA